MNKVAQAIVYLRKRAGYTQKELAQRLGVSDKAVSKWERGIGLPDVSCLRKLALLLDTDSDSLLAGDVVHHDDDWSGLLLLDHNSNGVGLHTMTYDKPIVYILLSYFLLVGIRKIYIACSAEDQQYMRRQFGDGSELGASLIFIDRDRNGVPCISNSGAYGNYMVVYGRHFIYGADQTRFFQKAMIHRDRVTVLSAPYGDKPYKKLFFDGDKKILGEQDGEKVVTQYDYHALPVLFCPGGLLERVCRAIAGDEKSMDSLLRELPAYTETLDRGFIEASLDTCDEVMQVSNLIKILQDTCGLPVYSLEEIVRRRGLVAGEEI